MPYQFLYSMIFLGAVLVSAAASIAAWQRRTAPGGRLLFIMMAAVSLWNLFGLFEVAAINLGVKIFWSKMGYLCAHSAPVLFLLFALEYTHRRKWVTPLSAILFFILPAITIVLAFTNEWHGLIWTGFTPIPQNPHIYVYQHGIWFWVETVYINFIMFFGTFFFLQFVLRSKGLFRWQNIALVIASLFPWAGFLIYIFKLSPFPALDITPVSFTFTATILVFTISRLHFLDVIPVAREVMIDNMIDGLLVLDEQNRVLDINPAAMHILSVNPASACLGEPIESLLPAHSDLVRYMEGFHKVEREWVLDYPQLRYYDLQVSPLFDRTHRLTGKSIVFRDITSRKNIEQQLQQVNQQLAEKLAQIEKLKDELRDQAIRDELTGLYNRRYVEEVFSIELAQTAREDHPLSIVIIDIDHFKEYNDTYGHLYGDSLMRTLGQTLRTHFRAGDIACRYGGDEFLLIMPNSRTENTFARIEKLHAVCQRLSLIPSGEPASINFSAGIATYPTHATTSEELLKVADRALYSAKLAGRNRTHLP